MVHDCDTCKHRDKLIHEEPCNTCCSSLISAPYEYWEPKEDEEKGEENV